MRAFDSLTRWLAAPLTCAAACLLSALPAAALAQNVAQYFELDGNTALTAGGLLDDWNTINNTGNNDGLASRLPEASGKIVSRVFIKDPAPQTIFTTGGSKDGNNIGSWRHKSGSVPDKDNIVNAYAAAYNIGGDLVIYAGADRFDNSGDAFMGFWFFKQNVQALPGGTFSGLHAEGDILLLANFTGGGTTVSIEVLEWTASGTLQQVANIPNAACGASGSPYLCGVTNAAAGETPSWSHTNKDGGSSFQVAGFLEVGINITKVLQAAGVSTTTCFSSFMAETRSSSSVTATLKDFALGNFEVCGITVTKQCPAGKVAQDEASIDYSFNGKVTNTGFGAVSNIVLTDTPQAANPPASVNNNFLFTDCAGATLPSVGTVYAGPLAAGASVCYSSTFNTTIKGSNNRMDAVANTSPTTTTSAKSDLAVCPPVETPTGITADKACTASLVASGGFLVVRVDVSGNVCNTGNLTLTQVAVTDTPAAVLTIGSTVLGPKGSTTACTGYSGYYFPSAPNPGTTTEFSDVIRARGTPPPIAGVQEVNTAGNDPGATCNLCAGTQCRTTDGTLLEKALMPSNRVQK